MVRGSFPGLGQQESLTYLRVAVSSLEFKIKTHLLLRLFWNFSHQSKASQRPNQHKEGL